MHLRPLLLSRPPKYQSSLAGIRSAAWLANSYEVICKQAARLQAATLQVSGRAILSHSSC